MKTQFSWEFEGNEIVSVVVYVLLQILKNILKVEEV